MSAINAVATRLKLTPFGRLRLFMILLTAAGLGVSAYLMWGYTVESASLACGNSHGCEAVKNSVYSSMMGVPLPLIGLVVYSILLLLLISQNHVVVNASGWSPHIALTIFGLALIGTLFSAHLTYLELFVIYAICRWCVASAIIITATFFLSIFNLYGAAKPQPNF